MELHGLSTDGIVPIFLLLFMSFATPLMTKGSFSSPGSIGVGLGAENETEKMTNIESSQLSVADNTPKLPKLITIDAKFGEPYTVNISINQGYLFRYFYNRSSVSYVSDLVSNFVT